MINSVRAGKDVGGRAPKTYFSPGLSTHRSKALSTPTSMLYSHLTPKVHVTNDHCTVSKLSAALTGYFQDDILKFFVQKCSRRSPLIHRGYYIRFKAVEHMFNAWLDHIHSLGTRYQIISLGAGFDTSYFRLKKLGKLKSIYKFIEIDFPEVLIRKSIFILSNKELTNLLFKYSESSAVPEIILKATEYILLGLNMNELQKVKSLFDILEVDYTLPTLLLAEASVSYMDIINSNQLIQWICKNFKNSDFVLYEQVFPNDSFGLIMRKHFISLGSPLKSIATYPDPQSLCDRFSKAGWPETHYIVMSDFFRNLPDKEKVRLQNLELFDEYETWHQQCSHYVMMCASQGPLSTFHNLTWDIDVSKIMYFKSVICPMPRKEAACHFQRWGHQVVKISSESFIMYGGFGYSIQKHQRLKNLVSYNLKNTESSELKLLDQEDTLDEIMYHTMTAISFGRILIFGGRSSPNKSYGNIIILYPIGKSLSTDVDSLQDRRSNKAQIGLSFIAEKKMCVKPRWRHSGSVAFINGIEFVVFFGGCTPLQKATNDCLMLNTNTWAIEEMKQEGNIPCPRHSHSSVEYGNKHIITGGLTAEEKCLNDVHILQVETCSWTHLNVKGLLPRYSHTSHIWNKHLILIGGVNDLPGYPPFVAIISLESLIAVELLMPAQETDDIILLHNHSSLLYENSIITVGGGGNCFSFGTHFNKSLLIFDINNLIDAYSGQHK